MSKNDIAFGYRIDALPGPTPKRDVLAALMAGVQNGGQLPDGYAVTWRWQNSPRQDWREDDFSSVVEGSRGGFLALMLRRLARDAGVDVPEVREATEAEIAAIEAGEARTAEQRKAAPGEATRAKRAAAAAKRKATIQRKQREARRVFKRRSVAAVKGWETRRRNERARARARHAKRRR